MSACTSTAVDPLAEFMREARTIAFRAADHGSHRLYERLKGMYLARFQDHPPALYERTCRELAKMAGV